MESPRILFIESLTQEKSSGSPIVFRHILDEIFR
jgi:hypothetical protein